jgi:uncharacterized membrane protein YukC
MKLIYNKDNRLESHKFFKYMAWLLVLLFAYFVYTLAMDLRAATDHIGSKTKSLEEKASSDISEIKDFSL